MICKNRFSNIENIRVYGNGGRPFLMNEEPRSDDGGKNAFIGKRCMYF
jgi:hypothetical protein